MKINEVMLEASVDRKQFGKETVRANQKANIARSAAFRAQMDAPAAAPTAPEAPATPSGPVNYGKGTPGIPNIQVTPGIKTPKPAAKPGTQASPTPTPGVATPGPTGTTPVPGAGMPTPPGAGMPKPVTKTPGAAAPAANADTGWKGKDAGGNLPGASFLKGFTKAAGMTDATNAIDAAQRSNIDYDLMAKQKATADADKAGQPAAEPGATPVDAATPATGTAGELSPGASKPGATSNYGPKAAQPVTLANPISKTGAATPGQPQTQDSPVAEPGAATPAPATLAKGKAMTKQEILSWISRNDEDNAALQSFKDGITAAEKSGAGTATGDKPDYSKGGAGIQNVQVTPDKVGYAPKTAAPAATPAPAAKQTQLASKQYKKVPL